MQQGVERDWDDAYANMAYIPDSDKLPDVWAKQAAEYRSSVRIDEGIAYGSHPREKFDLVWPDGPPEGLAVFVHGGYWLRMDRTYWTHLAEGARSLGWAVALPQYTLAPQARLAEMTKQIGAAISKACTLVEGPLRIAGHSAGGHLVSRMACADSPLSQDAKARLQHTLSISGLHDLRPLMWTQMNDELCIDEAEAQLESAALLRPLANSNVTAWVGGDERPEFIRQSRLLDIMWNGLGAEVTCVEDGKHDHFSVIEALRDPNSAITAAFVK